MFSRWRRSGPLPHVAPLPVPAQLPLFCERTELWHSVVPSPVGNRRLIHARFEADRRLDREQVRTILHSEGFATLGPGVYIHPRVRATRLLSALRERGLTKFVTVIRGRVEGKDPEALAAGAWNLETLAEDYRDLIGRYEEHRDSCRSGRRRSCRRCGSCTATPSRGECARGRPARQPPYRVLSTGHGGPGQRRCRARLAVSEAPCWRRY